MQQKVRVLDLSNIDEITEEFQASIESIGSSIQGLNGIPLLIALKREKLAEGPYPGVSLFEAANRIMSDLVILNGVSGLLKSDHFSFKSYTVEFGNENRNGFDIRASSSKLTLVGEAFNVAPSFFHVKKNAAQKKLIEKGGSNDYRILMYNHDAVKDSYKPKPNNGIHHIIVNAEALGISIISQNKAS